MKALGTITDRLHQPKKHNAFDRFIISKMRDERDLPFVYLTLKISLTMIPLGIAMYVPAVNESWWMFTICAIGYFYFNNFVFKGPFGLMLHCTSHRKWFKSGFSLANYYLPWWVGLFFGQTPETYFSHHIGMHHLENNMEADESSTMRYQRDTLSGFGHYFARFFFIGMITLIGYHKKKNRPKLLRKAIVGESFFFIFCILLSIVSFKATLMVFILPFVISRLIMMLGNWTQHSFIDTEEPDNLYKSSITCINVKYNWKCWNDGYHISHHLKPAMHWSEHPTDFQKNIDKYAENDAIVFDGMDFLQVFFALMNKNYGKLADHFVNIGDRYKTKEEVIALLKSRTKPVPKRA